MEAVTRIMVATRDTILTTDQHAGYGGVNKFMAHRTINHSVSYSERDLFASIFGATHTNTIEGFWAIVKRAIYGQFHHISEKYLPLYLNELTWRYSERRNPDRFAGVLHLAVKPQTA